MLFGLVKGAFKSALVLGLVGALGGSYGYYKLAARKLTKLQANEGAVITAGICGPTPSVSGGTLPLTFEAYVKDATGHNFLTTEGHIGLVRARYEWSHGNFAWIPDVGFAERQADLVAARKKIANRDADALIKGLKSDDPIVREVSARELKIRTNQTFGYAYDLPKEEREKATAAWDQWWAKDENRYRYGAKRSLDHMDGALDALRRALGTDDQPAPETPKR